MSRARLFAHRHFRFLPASLAVVVVALFTLPLAVSAAPPLVETFTEEGSFYFQGACDNGVTLHETYTQTERWTTFFDADGNPVRVQIKLDFFGVVTNPDTGASVEDISHQTYTLDLVDGTETTVGLVFTSTVPGVGVVFHDVGRVVSDAEGNLRYENGPHDVLHTEGPHPVRELFCEALT